MLLVAACSGPVRHAGGDLHGVLWIQTAAEYRASCLQVFARAAEMLDEALVADVQWTAALEQDADDLANKRPAIIVDVDETVLDNTPYNARLLEDGEVFSVPTWNAWVEEGKAHGVPGARGFLDHVTRRGVTVFYVTNRGHEVEAATRANLEALGFPLATDLDTVLTRSEYDDAGSEKEPRRRRVAETHRILLLLGDDLGDFAAGARTTPVELRRAMVDLHSEMWGRRWFVLPNPMYGSWLRALGDDAMAWLESRR